MLLLFSGPSWPSPGHPYGGHTDCGGRLSWVWVPPQDHDVATRGPGLVSCSRCQAELDGWPDTYDALDRVNADAAIEAAGDLGDDEDDTQTLRELLGITDEVRAAVRAWLSARPAPRTGAERSDLITAWLGSDLAAQLEAGGAHGGTLLGLVTAACPRLEQALLGGMGVCAERIRETRRRRDLDLSADEIGACLDAALEEGKGST